MTEEYSFAESFAKEQTKLMKPSTMAFALKQCALNGERMAREARGNYGQPIHIIFNKEKEDG